MEKVLNLNCPCRRFNCERHGDCKVCKEHHRNLKSGMLPTCERLKVKEQKKKEKGNLTKITRK